ncbi:hypothetical protein APHAL10511_001977 [Amanita phalloides]|nr:hypothetical protein APHAL10511_001977 [Amanita phalloides]
MSSLLADYSSASQSDIHSVLQSIIDASPPSLDLSDRHQLLLLLLQDLKNCGKSRLSIKDAAHALLALKTLGKDPTASQYLSSTANLSTLLGFTATFKDDPDAVSEALRTIANTLLLTAEARSTFVGAGVAGGMLAAIMLEKASVPEQIYILSRILFLCTASPTPFVQTLVEEKHHGRTMADIVDAKLDLLTIAILSGIKLAREAMSDLLKFTFNLLLHYPRLVEPENNDDKGDTWGSRLDGVLPPLLRTFYLLPPTFPSPIAPPLTHVIHALLTIPVSPHLRTHWFSTSFSPNRNGQNTTPKSASPTADSRSDSPTRANQSAVLSPKPSTLDRALSMLAPHRRSGSRVGSPGSNMDVVQRAMDLLDVSFSHFFPGETDADDPSIRERVKRESPDNSLDDLLSPLAVLISRLCLADENTRARIRQWIVPDDLDRTSALETRLDILGRCLRVLGSVYHPRLRDSVGEMLFAMADSNANTLSALVGYGNVAGYLFNKGILNVPPPTTNTINASLTTPNGRPINPITGTTEKPESSTPDMTDEEKEREMEKLFVLFDRLEKSGSLPREQNPIRKAIQEGKLGV